MPRRAQPTGPVAPKSIRLIGLATFFLTIICLTVSCNAPNLRIQIGFMIAGILYLLTTVGLVFDNGIDTGENKEE